MNNTIIEEVEHIKFLAVYIDQHLAWKMHICYICTKISKTIGMLYKTRFHALNKSLLSLHYSPASCHSLSFYHFSISSHSDLSSLLSWFVWGCSRSNLRCSLSRILLFIWTVALATPCINARWLLFVDSKDSTFKRSYVQWRQFKQSWSLRVRWEDFGRRETGCRRVDSSVVWPENLEKWNKIRLFSKMLILRVGDIDPFFPLGMLVLMPHKPMSCFFFLSKWKLVIFFL